MQIVNILALCASVSYYFTLVTCTPVPQEAKATAGAESNLRKAYLSKQFEDHTKNFILRAKEVYELQAERRKQQAKTKKAYSSINQLPVSSTTGEKVPSLHFFSRLPMPLWLVSTHLDSFDDSELKLTRSKRDDGQTTPSVSSMNLDSALTFIKEQTEKLEQLNRQLKSLASSVSQGLGQLQQATGLGQSAGKATAAGQGSSLTSLINSFNSPSTSSSSGSSGSTSSSLGNLASMMPAIGGKNDAAPSATSTMTANSNEMISSLQQGVASTLGQIQSAAGSVLKRMSPSNGSQTSGQSSGQSSDALTSILQG